MPGVGVAGVYRENVVGGVIHGELQRHHGVAAHGISPDKGVGCGGVADGVEVAVNPPQAVARHLLVNAGGGLADGELQSINARTVVVVVVRVSHNAGIVVRGSMPGVGVAVVYRIDLVGGVIHGEVQRHHGVAARDVGQRPGRRAVAGGVGVAVYPLQTVARRLRVDARVAMVHGEVQRHHRIAVRGVGEGMCQVFARLGDVLVLVPVEAVTGCGDSVADSGLADGELQGIDARATVAVDVLESSGAGSVVSGIMPGVGVAGVFREGIVGAVVHLELQLHHTVATRGVGERVGGLIVVAGVEVAVDPTQTVAGNNFVSTRVAVVDGEPQRHYTVATVGGRARVGVGRCCRRGCRIGVVMPRETVARDCERVSARRLFHRHIDEGSLFALRDSVFDGECVGARQVGGDVVDDRVLIIGTEIAGPRPAVYDIGRYIITF